MPYDRDQVITAVTDYYDFLTRLHLDTEDIRRPPPEGWPEITQERLGLLEKSDKVIDLLKHLPYVQNDDNFTPIRVWTYSGCCDYTGCEFWKSVARGFSSSFTPADVELEKAPREKLRKPHPHIVSLASPASKYGDYIMCDTEEGEFIIWTFWEDDYMSFTNAEECFSHLKKAFLEREVFPLSKETITELKDGREQDREIKRLAKEHGWPEKDFQFDEFTAAAAAEIEGWSP